MSDHQHIIEQIAKSYAMFIGQHTPEIANFLKLNSGKQIERKGDCPRESLFDKPNQTHLCTSISFGKTPHACFSITIHRELFNSRITIDVGLTDPIFQGKEDLWQLVVAGSKPVAFSLGKASKDFIDVKSRPGNLMAQIVLYRSTLKELNLEAIATLGRLSISKGTVIEYQRSQKTYLPFSHADIEIFKSQWKIFLDGIKAALFDGIAQQNFSQLFPVNREQSTDGPFQGSLKYTNGRVSIFILSNQFPKHASEVFDTLNKNLMQIKVILKNIEGETIAEGFFSDFSNNPDDHGKRFSASLECSSKDITELAVLENIVFLKPIGLTI